MCCDLIFFAGHRWGLGIAEEGELEMVTRWANELGFGDVECDCWFDCSNFW